MSSAWGSECKRQATTTGNGTFSDKRRQRENVQLKCQQQLAQQQALLVICNARARARASAGKRGCAKSEGASEMARTTTLSIWISQVVILQYVYVYCNAYKEASAAHSMQSSIELWLHMRQGGSAAASASARVAKYKTHNIAISILLIRLGIVSATRILGIILAAKNSIQLKVLWYAWRAAYMKGDLTARG